MTDDHWIDTSNWDYQDLLDCLRPWALAKGRTAWKPVTASAVGHATASSFCGTPVVNGDFPWPACKICANPLQMFLQLNISELPEEIQSRFDPGYVQVFYCRHVDELVDGEIVCHGEPGWEPFSDQCSIARYVPSSSEPDPTQLNHNETETFPPSKIVGWDEFKDLPFADEYEKLGLNCVYGFERKPGEKTLVTCPELGVRVEGKQFENTIDDLNTSAGDKLAGSPAWVQGDESPMCPECGTRMLQLMQIASEDNVPFMFGDCGTGHLTFCPEHPAIVAFGWACS